MLQSLDNGLLGKEFMRQPSLTQSFTAEHDQPTELDLWQLRYHSLYEMGTIFTMVAGLLNLLVIFDAAAGPVGSTRSDKNTLQRSLSDAPP